MAGASFYDQIAANRRNSFLMAAFVVVLLALLGATIGYAVLGSPQGALLVLAFAVLLGAGSGAFTYFAGDSLVLAVSQAREVDEAQAPKLMNVIRELAIAANVPMPKVYVIDDTAPNAFATGRDPAHASVAITTGLLDKLDREELQGVMGHELSHVRNYDIRFAMLLAVMVGLLALLADGFRRWMWWGGGRRRSSRDSGAGAFMAIIAIFAILFSIVAPILGKLIQLAASREREYLADASAVELTRNPEGLASALEKLGKDQEVLEVANRATQHLYIVNPFKPFETRAKGLLSTHPPLEERIQRLRALEGAARRSDSVVS